MSVARALTWRAVTLQNSAQLNLSNAAVALLIDDQISWPVLGKLLIDGFRYDGLSSDNEPRGLNWRGIRRAIVIGLRAVSAGWHFSLPDFIRSHTRSWRNTTLYRAKMRPR